MSLTLYRTRFTRDLKSRPFVDLEKFCLISNLASRNKINSVLATIHFISAPSVRTCRAEIMQMTLKHF